MAGRLFARLGALRQTVTFSQTRYASNLAVPSFYPSSSSELSDALNRFREEVFIPSALPKQQRESMFKEKSAVRLEEEQIVVNVNESEEYTLRPMKRADLPSVQDAYEVLKMIVSAKEYKNLIPFASGLRKSNYHLSAARWEYLIRHARMDGKLNYIIECARQGEQTGFRLHSPVLVQRLFFEFHLMAYESKYDQQTVKQTLNMAKQALDIMDATLPNGGPVRLNPKKQAGIIGTMLELSSVNTINEFDNDKLEEVLRFARRLLAAISTHDDDLKRPPHPKTDRALADKWVQAAVTVYSGLLRCLRVKGLTAADEELHKKVTSSRDEIEALLKESLQNPSLLPLDTPVWRHARGLVRVKTPRYEPPSDEKLQDETARDQKEK